MKYFALALLAGAANAWGQGYAGGNPWEQQHAQQQQQSGHNPWQSKPVAPTKPEGWWSATQQYSPPKIPFVAAKIHKMTYGICQIEDDDSIITTVDFGQSPGYPTMVKGQIEGDNLDDLQNEVWKFTVHKYGNISGMNCENVGPEFNPLAEFVYGQPNPYADPSRGTLQDVTITTPSPGPHMFNQTKFLQNLGGKNSIIGKSVKVTTERTNDMGEMENVVIGCCVVGQAAAPAPMAPPAPPQNQQQTWNQGPLNRGFGPRGGYGYGRYGNYNNGGNYGGYGGYGGNAGFGRFGGNAGYRGPRAYNNRGW